MIKESEYRQRRENLLKSMKKDSIGVLFAASYKKRSNDTEYPYRQESNFYYMSGFKEDGAALMFVKAKNGVKTILFVQKKDKTKELWSGKRLGVEKAKKKFLFDEVFEYGEFESVFKNEIKNVKRLYFDFRLDYSKVKILKRYAKNLSTHKNISPLIGKMRLVKSSAEIELVKKAIEITKKAHEHIMQIDKRTLSEYHIQSEIEYIFKYNAAYSDAYTSIVASGDNANTLHYINNDKKLKDGELILIDAGCEYEYYASDITRVVPVNGRFSKEQKELYEMVLHTQKQIVKMVKPGVKRSKLQKRSEVLLTEGMLALGILKGSVKKLMKKSKHKKYYPHGIGHWMGLDVHDDAPYKDENSKEIKLKEGMILTIEPGIYLPKDDKKIPKKYRGIGIRIEDDILVTKEGHLNLSKDIPKEVSEVESAQKI